jgi:DNA-binding PadR family transcriptional regulator
MTEDMPWVNLTQEEVDKLRSNKQQLTEYGKQRLKELMSKVFVPDEPEWYDEVEWDDQDNLTHEEMLEIAAQREAENEEMQVTEHNVDADLNEAELEALMALVKGQLSQEGNSQYVNLFYAKIYGKLIGMKQSV